MSNIFVINIHFQTFNCIDSGQLDSEEAKVYQQQLTSLINSNLLNTNNQTVNPLSAILAGRIFNPDAYCELCNKNFCTCFLSSYFHFNLLYSNANNYFLFNRQQILFKNASCK